MSSDRPAWHCLSKSTLLSHHFLALERHDLVNPRTGQPRPFFVLRIPDWVNVVAITDQDEVVLVRQMRAGIGAHSLELPGGLVEPGETPEAAARRELLEETGYRADDVVSLGAVHPNPALQDNTCHLFLMRGARRVAEPDLDPGEDIDVELHARPAVDAMLQDGTISHALVYAAFFRLGSSLKN